MNSFGWREGQNVEFKRGLRLRKEAFAALCAMVNAESAHGTVIFGIDDSGVVVGLDPGNLDTAQRTLMQHAAQKINPPLAVELHERTADGKQVLLMAARRLLSVPFHEYDGRAHLREGTSSRVLSVGEKQRLLAEREVQRALGLVTASLARLDREMIDPWERESVDPGKASRSALDILETKVTELETHFRNATARDKPAYAASLREVYSLYLRRARMHYASTSCYQAIRQRVVAGLLEIEKIGAAHKQ